MTKKEALDELRGMYPGKFTKACRLQDIKDASAWIHQLEESKQVKDEDGTEDTAHMFDDFKKELTQHMGFALLIVVLVLLGVTFINVHSNKKVVKQSENVQRLFEGVKKRKANVRPGKTSIRRRPPQQRRSQ